MTTDLTTKSLPFGMRLKDAAQYIGVSVDVLKRSDCPRSKIGACVVYLREDLEAYARQRRSHGQAA